MKQVESKVLTADDKKVNKEFQKELSFIRDTSKEVDKLDTQIVQSLLRIRDEKLYRGMYKTFEDACRAELHIERSEWARKLIAVETAEALKTTPLGVVLLKELDLNRAQLLELANNTDDVESQIKVLQHITDFKLEPTAKVVKSVCDEILPPTTESQEERAEKKRAAVAERKRLAEEKRTAAAEQKRIDDEKKAAAKLAAKEAREAAKAEAKAAAGRDKRTIFNPDEFEAATVVSAELPDDIQAIVDDTKEGSAIVRLIQEACRRAKAFFEIENGSGSWMKLNSVVDYLDKAELEVKMSLYDCQCPRCKKKHSIKCELCGGRKFLDKRHASMLTDAEKAALEAA